MQEAIKNIGRKKGRFFICNPLYILKPVKMSLVIVQIFRAFCGSLRKHFRLVPAPLCVIIEGVKNDYS
jgi:hypothetical protein